MAKQKKPKSKGRKIFEGIFTGIFVVLIAGACGILIAANIKKVQNPENKNAPVKIGNLYMPVLVITDSMEPVYPVNTAIFLQEVSCESIYQDYLNGSNSDLTFLDNFLVMSTTNILTPEELVEFQTRFEQKAERPTDPTKFTVTHQLFFCVKHDEVEYGKGKYLFFVQGINHNSKVIGAEAQYQVFTEAQLYGKVTGSSKFLGWCFTAATSPWGLIVLILIPSLYMIISSIIDVYRAVKEEENEELTGVNPDDVNKINDPLNGLSKKERERLKQEMLDEMMKGKGKKK